MNHPNGPFYRDHGASGRSQGQLPGLVGQGLVASQCRAWAGPLTSSPALASALFASPRARQPRLDLTNKAQLRESLSPRHTPSLL